MLDTTFKSLPNLPGVGYKPQHYNDIIGKPAPLGWLEIHAENYMGDGGRPLAQLRQLSEEFPISVHGVGLSIGAEGALDPDHPTSTKSKTRLAVRCCLKIRLLTSLSLKAV